MVLLLERYVIYIEVYDRVLPSTLSGNGGKIP